MDLGRGAGYNSLNLKHKLRPHGPDNLGEQNEKNNPRYNHDGIRSNSWRI